MATISIHYCLHNSFNHMGVTCINFLQRHAPFVLIKRPEYQDISLKCLLSHNCQPWSRHAPCQIAPSLNLPWSLAFRAHLPNSATCCEWYSVNLSNIHQPSPPMEEIFRKTHTSNEIIKQWLTESWCRWISIQIL